MASAGAVLVGRDSISEFSVLHFIIVESVDETQRARETEKEKKKNKKKRKEKERKKQRESERERERERERGESKLQLVKTLDGMPKGEGLVIIWILGIYCCFSIASVSCFFGGGGGGEGGGGGRGGWRGVRWGWDGAGCCITS